MRRRARALERRELSLELGDARGQSVPLGLERLAVARAHHHNLRLAPRFLNVGLGHCFLLLSSDDFVEVVEARAREELVLEDLGRRRADGGVRGPRRARHLLEAVEVEHAAEGRPRVVAEVPVG